MIRPFGKMVVSFGLVALLAAPALAQGQGGRGFGGGGGGAGFLMAPNVQKDLKLTDEQVGKVQSTLTEIREKHADDYAALRDASQDERPAKMLALSSTVNTEVKKALALNEEQSKRFDQIVIQTRGLQAFSDPAVGEKLKLTSEQKEKIRAIAEASRGQFQGAFNKDASEAERTEARAKMQATQKENMTKVHALLSDEQKTAYKELTGEHIDIQIPRRPQNN